MMYGDLKLAQMWINMRVDEMQRQAERAALAREARVRQADGISGLGSRLLVGLGSQLVLLGERLERTALVGTTR